MKDILAVVILSFLVLFVGCDKGRQFAFDAPNPPGLNYIQDIGQYADLMREGTADTLLNDPALTAVTQEYGPTVLKARTYPYKSSVARAQKIPWSSWWYPKKDKFLFEDPSGHNSSTLEKYDAVRKLNDPGSKSAAEFERRSFNPLAKPWEGLCDAWSLAAISAPEPKHSVSYVVDKKRGKRVTFEVADLKALLLKTYEGVEDQKLKYYGQKFTGDFSGWIYPDIYPEQFHRFVEVQLFENHQAFIMDHDAGIEVWNVPIYKANFTMATVLNKPNEIYVRMWVYSAESVLSSDKNAIGTREAVREYDYVLLGTKNPAGDFVVNSGYWVKGPDGVDSRQDHPDYVIKIPELDQLARRSWNPEIDVELVDKILEGSQ